MTCVAAGNDCASVSHNGTSLPIVPNYIAYPPFPHATASNDHFQPNAACAVPSSCVDGKWIKRFFYNELCRHIFCVLNARVISLGFSVGYK